MPEGVVGHYQKGMLVDEDVEGDVYVDSTMPVVGFRMNDILFTPIQSKKLFLVYQYYYSNIF